MLRSILFLVSVWFFWSASYGQLNGFIWHQVGIENGLSQATNAFVFKDSRGFVWISSMSGLNRYDGTSVRVYMPDVNDPASLLGENVQSEFFEDPQGDIWFTTHSAINKYNWDHDCFDHYQVMDKEGNARSGYYIFYKDPQQYLWLLVESSQLYTFHIPTGTLDFKGDVDTNTIRCFPVLDQHGNLNKILMRGRDWPGIHAIDINDRGAISLPYVLSQSTHINSMIMKSAVADGDSAVWILSPLSLTHYAFTNRQVASYVVSGGESMIRLNDSIFLIGTLKEGLKTFNFRRRAFLSAPENPGPRSPSGRLQKINYMFRDRDGTIWATTDGVGLHYTHPGKNKFDFINFSDYVPGTTEINPIQMFEDQPGKILCFTPSDGVLEINFSEHSVNIGPYKPLEGIKPYKIHNVTKDFRGLYWIGTWSGIFVFLPSTLDLVRVTDSLTIGLSSAATPDGPVYYTTSLTGLYEANIGHDGKPVYTVVKAIPENEVYMPVLLDHKNRIWLSHDLNEFNVFDPITYEQIATIPGKGHSKSLVVTEDGKTIYIGSSTGLFEIDEATLTLRKIHTEQTGLPAAGINSVLKDEHGHFWLGHSKGITALDPKTTVAKAYGIDDGLPSAEFTQAACKLNNGLMCFAAINGIATFYPDSVKDIGIPAIPQISDLQINDKIPDYEVVCQETGTTHFPLIETLVFKYRYNTLSFKIHSLEYSAPESNTLQYKMEGLDEGFVTEKNGNRIRYPEMPPGNYHFILYASNSDGIQNPFPRILHIVIKQPYYKTWWFMTGIALLVFSIVAYIIYLRFSKKLELQNIRLKLYENLHDDVGSRLTAIVLSAEDLEQNEYMSHPKIKAISKIARSIVGNMRRLVWAIDPENDKMMSIVQKINHDKSLILDERIEFSIEVDEHLKNVVLPGEIRYQMSSVCNEAFTNISKYAQASKVSVLIGRENKSIKLTVTDNGKGFDPEEKSKNNLEGSGYGMANMKRRASRAGGVFNIYSRPGQGTRIEFTFPLK